MTEQTDTTTLSRRTALKMAGVSGIVGLAGGIGIGAGGSSLVGTAGGDESPSWIDLTNIHWHGTYDPIDDDWPIVDDDANFTIANASGTVLTLQFIQDDEILSWNDGETEYHLRLGDVYELHKYRLSHFRNDRGDPVADNNVSQIDIDVRGSHEAASLKIWDGRRDYEVMFSGPIQNVGVSAGEYD